MELIKVNALHSKSPQRCIAFPADRFRLEHSSWLCLRVVLIPDQPTLGENAWPMGGRERLQEAAHNFLGVTQAVHGGGVDPIDAQLACVSNRRNGIVIVLRSPTVGPTTAAEGPRSKSGYSDWDSTQAERTLRQTHICFLQSPCKCRLLAIGDVCPSRIQEESDIIGQS